MKRKTAAAAAPALEQEPPARTHSELLGDMLRQSQLGTVFDVAVPGTRFRVAAYTNFRRVVMIMDSAGSPTIFVPLQLHEGETESIALARYVCPRAPESTEEGGDDEPNTD